MQFNLSRTLTHSTVASQMLVKYSVVMARNLTFQSGLFQYDAHQAIL